MPLFRRRDPITVYLIVSAKQQGICYSAPYRGAEYCDDRVCVCMCMSVRDYISGTTRPIFTKIFVIVTVARSSSYCWRRGVVVSGVRRMNEVNARRAWLVPG